MQGKRIIIAHNWSRQSVSTQSVVLAEELSKENKVIFISQDRQPLPYQKINDNLEVYAWPNKRPTSIKDFMFYYKLAKQFTPDATISQFGANTILAIVGWLLGTRVRLNWYHTLTEQTEMDFKKSKWRFYFERWRKKFVSIFNTHIVAVSNYAANDVVAYLGFRAEKVFSIKNGLPDTTIRNCNTDNNLFRFLGRFDNCKGADVLIDAMEIVVQTYPSIKVEMAGGGNKDLFLSMIEKKRLNNNIVIVGAIPYNSVLQFISEAYCLIVPSKIDNLPTVILEAFCTSTPVIGANAGGIIEMIEDKYNGLLFTKFNAADLAAKMIFIINDTTKRNEYAANARRTYEEYFKLDNFTKNVDHLLECLVK